jgi:hypothetical protein
MVRRAGRGVRYRTGYARAVFFGGLSDRPAIRFLSRRGPPDQQQRPRKARRRHGVSFKSRTVVPLSPPSRTGNNVARVRQITRGRAAFEPIFKKKSNSAYTSCSGRALHTLLRRNRTCKIGASIYSQNHRILLIND